MNLIEKYTSDKNPRRYIGIVSDSWGGNCVSVPAPKCSLTDEQTIELQRLFDFAEQEDLKLFVHITPHKGYPGTIDIYLQNSEQNEQEGNLCLKDRVDYHITRCKNYSKIDKQELRNELFSELREEIIYSFMQRTHCERNLMLKKIEARYYKYILSRHKAVIQNIEWKAMESQAANDQKVKDLAFFVESMPKVIEKIESTMNIMKSKIEVMAVLIDQLLKDKNKGNNDQVKI